MSGVIRITYIVYILHCRVLSDLARVRLTNFLKLPTYTVALQCIRCIATNLHLDLIGYKKVYPLCNLIYILACVLLWYQYILVQSNQSNSESDSENYRQSRKFRL